MTALPGHHQRVHGLWSRLAAGQPPIAGVEGEDGCRGQRQTNTEGRSERRRGISVEINSVAPIGRTLGALRKCRASPAVSA